MNATTYLDEDWEQEHPHVLTPLVEVPTSSSSAVLSRFSILSPPEISNGSSTPNKAADIGSRSNACKSREWMQCTICLDDYQTGDLKQHYDCTCILCQECIKKSANHFEATKDEPEAVPIKTRLKCAVCSMVVDPDTAFVSVGLKSEPCLPGMLLIPLLLRSDPKPDSNNNSSLVSRIFGYPWVIRLPSSLPAAELNKYLAEINPFPQCNRRFLHVSWDGKSCAHCLFSPSHCRGCELTREGIISLNPKNSLVISYLNMTTELITTVEPTDMAIQSNPTNHFSNTWSSWNRTQEPTIDIHDCLRAFSEIENLDDQNPWFCPECDKNQCATKALSVCRFPDYLIVYLKRFVFLDHSSNKLNNRLKFPVVGLDVSEYVAEEFSGNEYKYDLYSCVCHFGGASSGHYTAFGKNPNTAVWYYFNDSQVGAREPNADEYASAYILFYERRGLKHDIPGVMKRLLSTAAVNNYPCSSDRVRPVGVIPPNGNHFSGGSFQVNKSNSSTEILSGPAVDTRGSYLHSEAMVNSLDDCVSGEVRSKSTNVAMSLLEKPSLPHLNSEKKLRNVKRLPEEETDEAAEEHSSGTEDDNNISTCRKQANLSKKQRTRKRISGRLEDNPLSSVVVDQENRIPKVLSTSHSDNVATSARADRCLTPNRRQNKLVGREQIEN